MNYMEEDKAVRNFIIIFVLVLLIVVGIYFFTAFINKDNETKNEDTNTTEEVKIDNTKVIVGTMLQKSESNYYVILYKSDDKKASEYDSIVSKYKTSKGALAIYTIDLSEGINSNYYDKEHTNYSSDKVSDLRFGDITLLEIKNKKIVKAIDSIEKINKELKNS